MAQKRDVIGTWRDSAQYWDKHRDIIRQMFAPVSQALIADAGVGSGDQVLDIATGPGEPALSVATLVGPAGKVFGIDPAPEMVESARRAAVNKGIANAQFEVAPADRLPFPDNTFDAVVSRFGVMFFPSPLDAVREMLRVLKPGRRLALAVWSFAASNPFHYSLSRVMERYVESPPPEPDAPEAFRFAQPGKLRDILAEAGVTAPSERLLQFSVEAPLPPAQFWELRREMSDKLRTSLASLPEGRLTDVTRDVLASLSEYSTDAGMSFPTEVLIVSGSSAGATAVRA